MIKPTIGRVVWYHPPFQTNEPRRTLAAMVCYVHSDTCVNLAVFDENGVASNRMSVYLQQPEAGSQVGLEYCEWMPYQQGQAAKTEAVEKELVARI